MKKKKFKGKGVWRVSYGDLERIHIIAENVTEATEKALKMFDGADRIELSDINEVTHICHAYE